MGEGKRTATIQAAYHLSRCGVVALALRGVSRESVDRALDPVVDVRKDPHMGVVYFDADQPNEDMLSVVGRASVVIASSEAFRAELVSHGIYPLPRQDGSLDWFPEGSEDLLSPAFAG